MTFTVVDQMKRRYPNSEIVLLSSLDSRRTVADLAQYKFKILPWDLETRIMTAAPLDLRDRSLNDIDDLFKNAMAVVDISGYALSSQLSRLSWLAYLLNVAIAKRYSIPFFILPQSLGPFNYGVISPILKGLFKAYLSYPRLIFAREEEGYRLIKSITPENSRKEFDVVLTGTGYDEGNIFTHRIGQQPSITEGSVGIIPNMRVIERAEHSTIIKLYQRIVQEIVTSGKTVYLLHHSHEDLDFCLSLKAGVDSDRVVVIEEELNAIDIESTIAKFDFVVASRYHSIIHAYKHGVPAYVIGWATKYHELLSAFEQYQYFADVRSGLDEDAIIQSIKKMIVSHQQESVRIKNRLDAIRKCSVFDDVCDALKA